MTDTNAPFSANLWVDREVIRLTRNGVWLSDDVEIDHEQTVRLFARSLQRDDHGYYLRVAHETKRIEVEDTAYFVTSVEGSPAEGYEMRLSDETRERLNPDTLAYRPGRLVARIKGGAEEAKFLHAAYFELLRDLQEDAECYWLGIAGRRVVLARK